MVSHASDSPTGLASPSLSLKSGMTKDSKVADLEETHENVQCVVVTGIDTLSEKIKNIQVSHETDNSSKSDLHNSSGSGPLQSSTRSSPATLASPENRIPDNDIEKADLNETQLFFTIKSAGAKGFGVFATSNLHRGTTILLEKPLMQFTRGDYLPEDIEAEYNKLPQLSQEAFMTLASVHNVKSTRGRIRPKMDLKLSYPPEVIRLYNMVEVRTSKKRSVLSTFYANAITTEDGASIFLQASRINHSCVPNASYAWAPHHGAIQIRVTRQVKENEEITISYIDPCDIPCVRRRALQNSYDFTCDCIACGDDYDPNSFAAQSHDRRYRLSMIRVRDYRFEPRKEFHELPKVIEAFEKEGLCVPQYGIACLRMGKLYAAEKGMEKHALRMLRLAVDTFMVCLGPEFKQTKKAVKALDEMVEKLK